MTKIPCENCLILPLCINKRVLDCKLILEYLNNLDTAPYVDRVTMKLIDFTLKGDWFVWTIQNNVITKLKRSMRTKDEKNTMCQLSYITYMY